MAENMTFEDGEYICIGGFIWREDLSCLAFSDIYEKGMNKESDTIDPEYDREFRFFGQSVEEVRAFFEEHLEKCVDCKRIYNEEKANLLNPDLRGDRFRNL